MDINKLERRIFLSELNSEMKEKNITQKELGKFLGIRQSQLSLWLSGNTSMSIDKLIRITNAVKNWENRNNNVLKEPETIREDTIPSLGFLIKKHLEQSGMAQKTLAVKVGTSQSRISEYVRGKVVPSLGVAARICRELKINPEDFVEASCRL